VAVVVDVSTAVRERAAVAERGSGASPALPTIFFEKMLFSRRREERVGQQRAAALPLLHCC
jgi:hypothetical protein